MSQEIVKSSDMWCPIICILGAPTAPDVWSFTMVTRLEEISSVRWRHWTRYLECTHSRTFVSKHVSQKLCMCLRFAKDFIKRGSVFRVHKPLPPTIFHMWHQRRGTHGWMSANVPPFCETRIPVEQQGGMRHISKSNLITTMTNHEVYGTVKVHTRSQMPREMVIWCDGVLDLHTCSLVLASSCRVVVITQRFDT